MIDLQLPAGTRILPEAEWPRLVETGLGETWRLIPAGAVVVVKESDGKIVGCHTITTVVVVEGLWMDDNHRTPGALRSLWLAVRRTVVARFGARAVVTSATDDRVRTFLDYVGATKMPGEQYTVQVGGKLRCQS